MTWDGCIRCLIVQDFLLLTWLFVQVMTDPYIYKYVKGAIFGLKLHGVHLKINLINIVFKLTNSFIILVMYSSSPPPKNTLKWWNAHNLLKIEQLLLNSKTVAHLHIPIFIVHIGLAGHNYSKYCKISYQVMKLLFSSHDFSILDKYWVYFKPFRCNCWLTLNPFPFYTDVYIEPMTYA